jgi:hypothetical protein
MLMVSSCADSRKSCMCDALGNVKRLISEGELVQCGDGLTHKGKIVAYMCE